jgi:hypothetical protein
MAFLDAGYEVPEYLTLIADWDKIKESATESLKEYLITNRFGMAPERIDVSSPILRSIQEGYKANVKRLDYNFNSSVKNNKIVTKKKLLKYDFLGTAGLCIPVMKAPIAELFKQYCGDKVQIIDVVITLQSGEEITDYKAVNVINRVEAFTWEGSEKNMYYTDYNEPHASSMSVISFDKQIVNKAVICKDSVTNVNVVLISDDFGRELLKHKFKGLGVFFEGYGRGYRISG